MFKPERSALVNRYTPIILEHMAVHGVESLWLYGHISLERRAVNLSIVKKTAAQNNRSRKFPDEAYEWDDDVTKEAVDKVRDEVRPFVEAVEWEVIDGFGRNATR